MSTKFMPAIALAVVCLVTGCASEGYSEEAYCEECYTLGYQGDYAGYSGWYADYLLLQDCITDWECEVAEVNLCESYPESDPLDMQELHCE